MISLFTYCTTLWVILFMCISAPLTKYFTSSVAKTDKKQQGQCDLADSSYSVPTKRNASFSPYSFIPERSKDVFILSYSLNDKSTHTQPSPSQCKSRTTTRNNQNHFTTHTCFQTRRACYTFLPLWSTSWQNWSINLKEILLLNMLNSSSTFNRPGSYRGFHGLGFSLFTSWVVK